ncbi:hypothetical protein [Flavobacterium reichenbachii]|uniref:CHAT domain-containing protein n=1 Tax=Flavobacterium reichenbachii TaxID=362418 RepID=A0A085ZPG2_9FLAO|nr:hypothetical protein [Flavobacterium reichenbachii]KFF06326.1 hypothetical protein IW19_12680 [Flavobacterium reichenbachii]OXB17459.1 hypothetical protein B0A68_03955 [Flavobacterium reichenbachii]
MEEKIPEIDNEFFCIANYDNPILSALVSSFVSKFGKYLPMFEFSSVTSANNEADKIDEEIDEHQLSRVRATELNIKIKNTLKRIGGCNLLLLIDLSEAQKSYLTFLEEYTIVEIKDIHDVEIYLRYASNKTEYLNCSSNDIYAGLYYASENNLLLKIDETAEKIEINDNKDGIIIIEKINYVSTIIAVNYAISINATLKIIDPVTLNEREIYELIEKWQDGDANSFNDLSANIYPNVESINFLNYRYATFFTIGAPYSLILKNIIPFTHVHLYLNPDFFIFNNLYFQNNYEIKSAIVFSPLEFNDEETDYVISKFSENNYYVKELIGKDATVYNIDNHVKEYPFDFLHICSHGGEINGYSITEKFIDSNGNSHIVEYDEIVSFAPSRGKKLIPVTTKMIWRKFDGYHWKSKELKEANFPHHVFSDMLNELRKNKNKNRIPKSKVPNSCAIKCFDFSYQAMFNLLAGSQSPIIFNNTCWSYSDISHKFIEVGARAYIGTLWGINNNIAKRTAESFYSDLFNGTILGALQSALINTVGTNDENIYFIWGLHFTSIKAGTSNEESKKDVALKLLQSINIWVDKLNTTTKPSIQKNIIELIEWNEYQLARYFIKEVTAIIDEGKVINR